jgi:hypothetical protein
VSIEPWKLCWPSCVYFPELVTLWKPKDTYYFFCHHTFISWTLNMVCSQGNGEWRESKDHKETSCVASELSKYMTCHNMTLFCRASTALSL